MARAPQRTLHRGTRLCDSAMTIAEEVAIVAARAGEDAAFADRLGLDPVAILVEVGCDGLADEVRRERERIRQLADRIDEDDAFCDLVERDPAVIVESGIPRDALEPVLCAIGARDALLDRAKTAATHDAMASVLGAFAFAQEAANGERSTTRLGPVRRPDPRHVPLTRTPA